MNAEILNLYEKLQDKFQVAMGSEQVGDRIYDLSYEKAGFISDIFLPGNRIDYVADNGNAYWTKDSEIIRLPLPIDPVNPERGLCGMVDGLMGLTYNGTLYNCIAWRNNKEEWGGGNTPTEALLRALIAQEGL